MPKRNNTPAKKTIRKSIVPPTKAVSELKPIAFKLPEKLKLRVQNTLKLRQEHQAQLEAYQTAVADNTRAINNLVLGFLTSREDIDFENYNIQITDEGDAVLLFPKPAEVTEEKPTEESVSEKEEAVEDGNEIVASTGASNDGEG